MASASDPPAHLALQPADRLILPPQPPPAAVETSIGPPYYPAECTQSEAFVQPSLRARKGHANSDSFQPSLRARKGHANSDSFFEPKRRKPPLVSNAIKPPNSCARNMTPTHYWKAPPCHGENAARTVWLVPMKSIVY